MSSAVTLGSQSPVPATASNRPYTAGSSQSRDPYYNQNTANASPASARPSRNNAGSGNSNPQQTPYYSPSGSTSNSNMAPRTAAAGDQQRSIPPRTSSNRNTAQAAASKAAGSQRSNGTAQTNGVGSDDAIAAANAAARARRRDQSQEVSQRPSGSREPRAVNSNPAVQARQALDAGTGSPSRLSRETSEVLNRVVVSRPEVDVERERERMAEAVPSSPATLPPGIPAGSLGVVPADGIDDNGRGGRSRHDHGTSKREKNSRFGEYFLGNTLGEGEFGKVKMGWKQEGGVQVSSSWGDLGLFD